MSLLARCEEDRCTLSLEASLGSMHKRGWRTHTGGAPLRESLAMAMLQAAEWTPEEALLDPMCGSGTIPIEAARKALGIMPREDSHHYGVMDWANFDAERLAATQQLPQQHAVSPESLAIWGRDRDDKVLIRTRDNAKSARVADAVNFEHIALADGARPCTQPGLVISNPPYGERLSDAGVMKDLGEMLRRDFEGWRVALLMAEHQRPPMTGQRWEERLRIKNGGLQVKLMVCDAL